MHIELISKNKLKVTHDVTKQDFQAALDAAYPIVSKDVALKGFRKGKAPKNLFLAHYGEKSLYHEALNILINERGTTEELDEYKARFYREPKLDLDPELDFKEGFSFSFDYDLIPEVTLGEYTGIQINEADYAITDAEVTRKMEEALVPFYTKESVDKKSAIGDYLLVSYKSTSKEGELESKENMEIELGKNALSPVNDEDLVGFNAGDVTMITVDAENQENQLTYEVTIHEVLATIAPQITKEFITANFPLCESEDLFTYFKVKLNAEFAERKESVYKRDIFTKVVSNATVEVPEEEVEVYVNNYIEGMAKQLNSMEVLEMFLGYQGQTLEDFRAKVRVDIANDLKESLVERKITEVESLVVSKEELTAALKTADKKTEPERLYEQLLRDKVTEFLYSKAIINK